MNAWTTGIGYAVAAGMVWSISGVIFSRIARDRADFAVMMLVCTLIMSVAHAEDRVDVEALVRGLGADRFQEREEASAALVRAGADAVDALHAAIESGDPEVRMRAEKVLATIRLGIGHSWPKELADLARSFDSLSIPEKREAMFRINRELKADAVPFLVMRLHDVDGALAAEALRLVREQDSNEAAQQVLLWMKRPLAPLDHIVVAWAQHRLGHPVKALEILVRQNLTDRLRGQIMTEALQAFQGLWKARRFDELQEQIVPWIEAAPDEARFLYYQAEALDGLGKADAAAATRERALALHPEDEAAHYTAGDMLFNLGLWKVSAGEWLKILKIPPENDVYDMNALLRLGDIAVRNKQFHEAADHYQKVLDLYRKARQQGGSGFGMVGASDADLERKIQQLRNQEAKDDAAGRVEDISVEIQETVKEDKAKEMGEALAGVEATLTVRVQPHGMRLFDLDVAGLRWDREKKQILPLLNGQPCSDPVAFQPSAKRARVALRALDCIYIYEIDTETGAAKKLARYEKDYTVTIKPGPSIRLQRNVRMTLNGEPADWREFLGGRPFDFLPATFKITLEGETEEEKPMEMKVDLTDLINRKASEP
jgi:tetratricopeptide (TPR) repeat protein